MANKAGRKMTRRRDVKEKEDPSRLPAVYRFRETGKAGSRKEAIPVWLETQDPDFTISGNAEIVGINPKLIDKAVMRMIREERKIACTAFYYLQTQPRLPEKENTKLKPRARTIFLMMEEINAELQSADEEESEVLRRQMLELDEELQELVERSRFYPQAMTLENPYIKEFLRYCKVTSEHMVSYQMAHDLCHHIVVNATITDEAWLADPKYKGDEGFFIPEMKINTITAYPKYSDYRDILPDKFRSKFSTRNLSGKGKELYRKWEGHEEAVLRLKRSKKKKS